MSKAIDTYIDRVMVYANPKLVDEPTLRAELRDHLETKVEQLKAEGTAVEDAVFAAIEDHGPAWRVGYGLRPKWPWIDVRTKGTARGIIAIGPKAVGVFAFGGAAMGVFAMGGLAAGLVTWGGVCLALLFAWGGVGLAPLTFAALGAGIFVMGGLAVGVIAMGVTAIGLWAAGSNVINVYDSASMPSWATAIADAFGTYGSIWPRVYLGTFIGLVGLCIASILLQVREGRRITKADPHLAE